MKLIINGRIEEFKNNSNEIEPVLEKIKQALRDEELELSHLIVDGVGVYQDYQKYLCEKIDTVTEILVITLELRPLIDETLKSTLDYITNAISRLKPLVESFYQLPGQDTWNHLADFLEGIGWLLETMNRIDQIEQLHLYLLNYDIWNEYVQTMKGLNTQLNELEQAIVNKDHVLIGDLILYEILPVFELAKEKLRFMVPSGGNHAS